MDSKQFVQVIRTKYNKYTAVIERYHDKFRECLELQVSWGTTMGVYTDQIETYVMACN